MDKKTSVLILAYLDKSKEKLRSSEILLKAFAYDDAVSRAYYAVYHSAQAVLLSEGLTADTHQGVVNLFGLHFVRTGKLDRKFGKYLSNLKDERENGDYEVFSRIDKEDSEQALWEAREFLQAMESYLHPLLTPL